MRKIWATKKKKLIPQQLLEISRKLYARRPILGYGYIVFDGKILLSVSNEKYAHTNTHTHTLTSVPLAHSTQNHETWYVTDELIFICSGLAWLKASIVFIICFYV